MGYLADHPDESCVGDTDEQGNYVKRKPTALEIQQELDAELPEEQQAEMWLGSLLVKLKEEADRRVDLIITAGEVVHWIGVSNAISRKHDLWLAEKITASEEQRPADEVTYPPITDEEHQIWFSLALIQEQTSSVRGSAMAIAASWNMMTGAEKLAVADDNIINHILWP